MTREELAEFDGQNGNKAYVAVNGKVYDFTDSPLWEKGDHQGSHQAGRDLTEELKSAPHVRAVIEHFPVVDELHVPEEPSGSSAKLVIAVVIALALAAVAILVLR